VDDKAMLLVVVPVPPENVSRLVDALYTGWVDEKEFMLFAFPLLSLQAVTFEPLSVKVVASPPSNHNIHGVGRSVG
jgi:hypothetical protein